MADGSDGDAGRTSAPASDGRRRAWRWLWIVVPAAVPVVAAPWREQIGSLTVGLVTTVVVAAVAAARGRLIGGFAGLAGAAAFDLLVVHPYGTLAVSRRDDMVAIAAMGVVGLLVGHLSQVAAEERQRRVAATSELIELRSLLELAAAGEPPGRLVAVAEAAVHVATGLPCTYEAAPFPDRLPELHHASLDVPAGDRGPLATPRLLQVSVRSEGRVLGRFVLELPGPVPIGALGEGWRARVAAIADQLGRALTTTSS